LVVEISGNRGTQQEISVSTKVLNEIVPFQQVAIYECDVKNDPIGHPVSESDKKSDSHSQCCQESDSIQKPPSPYAYDSGSDSPTLVKIWSHSGIQLQYHKIGNSQVQLQLLLKV